MEKEYKFVSKFIEGKTYEELTEEEIEKIKSGVGVKKEDKEYFDSLNKDSNNNENITDEPKDISNENNNEKNINSESIEPKESENSIDKVIIEKSPKGSKIIQAFGKTLKLEDGRTINLKQEELKEKTFWCKGEIYYG